MNIIDERKRSKEHYNDLLSMLMEVEDADTAERMTDTQLRDEVLTIFLAGHETTANALTFIFYLISQHPDVRTKLKQEADDVLKGGNPTSENVKQLEYTLQVIEEGMRLYTLRRVLRVEKPLMMTSLMGIASGRVTISLSYLM